MKSKRFLSLAIVLGLCSTLDAEAGWKAGVASIKITPRQPLLMSGYASRDRPADGTLTDLWCKALVVEDASGHQAVLITADLIGVGREFATRVCGEIQARYALKRDQIAICSSHTHTGPVVSGTLAPMHRHMLDENRRTAIEQYTSETQRRMVHAVHEARQNLRSCELKWANGSATFATNRRENRPEQIVPVARTRGTLKGPVDHDVPVLAVFDAQNQKLRAVVFGYACHATVLSFYKWSGDYPGFAQMELEERFPGATALFWAGCGADQNPLPRRTVPLAKHYGRRLATAVEAVLLTTELTPVTATLDAQYAEIELPFDSIPGMEYWRSECESKDPYVAARAQSIVEQFESGVPPSKVYPYPVQSWKLGDEIQWVFLGGEVVVDFALRLKSEHSGIRTWVAGYTNDVMAYIPSRRVLREGGYEGGGAMVYYGLPAAWNEDVEEMVVAAANKQLDLKTERALLEANK